MSYSVLFYKFLKFFSTEIESITWTILHALPQCDKNIITSSSYLRCGLNFKNNPCCKDNPCSKSSMHFRNSNRKLTYHGNEWLDLVT